MSKEFLLISDTDSVFVSSNELLKHRFPDLDLTDENEVVPKLRNISNEFALYINNKYTDFTKKHFNTDNVKLDIKSETIGKALYISAKKQYAQFIVEKEGVKMVGDKKFDMKGLDFLKSSTSKIFREIGKEIIKDILEGKPKSEIDKKILEFRNTFKTLPLNQVAKPTGISKYKEYIKKSPSGGDIFTTLLPKCPANTKAAIYYNDLLKFKKLDKEYSMIQVGDKMLWMTLKKNPYNIPILGFTQYEPCPEIFEYIETYMDRQEMFDRGLVKKVQKIYDNLQWGPINFNANVASKVKYRK